MLWEPINQFRRLDFHELPRNQNNHYRETFRLLRQKNFCCKLLNDVQWAQVETLLKTTISENEKIRSDGNEVEKQVTAFESIISFLRITKVQYTVTATSAQKIYQNFQFIEKVIMMFDIT